MYNIHFICLFYIHYCYTYNIISYCNRNNDKTPKYSNMYIQFQLNEKI